MYPGLRISQTGLDGQQFKNRVIANNLANIDTVGFKRDRVNFQELVYQLVQQPGGASSQDTRFNSGLMAGTGVKVAGTQKIHITGSFQQTNNTLDLAIEGKGFFSILMPDGTTAYTRDGRFQINATGQVVTGQGYPLQPAITLTNEAVSTNISPDGTVSLLRVGDTSPSDVGIIQLFDFINPEGLQPMGGNLYKQTASSGVPIQRQPALNGMSPLRQGFVEGSNVNAVEELVNLIETQRGYEMNAKAIGTADDMLKYLPQVV